MSRVRFDFSGTTTVVTGGASGIGLSCAVAVAEAGGDVIITASRNPVKTEAALSRLAQASSKASASAHPCDVGDESSVAEFFGAIASSGSQFRYVVHSAGISPNTDFLEQTQQEWDEVHNVNSTGSFLVTKYAALAMKSNPIRSNGPAEAGLRGSILLVTSNNGINSNDPVSAHYDSSKAAANMLVKNAAEFLAPDMISVNGLAPGWIETDLNATVPPDVIAKESAKIWMGRFGMPEEMAAVALHMLTMPYYTGQVLLADGGYR